MAAGVPARALRSGSDTDTELSLAGIGDVTTRKRIRPKSSGARVARTLRDAAASATVKNARTITSLTPTAAA